MEDFKLVYIKNLHHGNYKLYTSFIIESIGHIVSSLDLTILELSRLSGVSRWTLGPMLKRGLRRNFKFRTINKLNNFIRDVLLDDDLLVVDSEDVDA